MDVPKPASAETFDPYHKWLGIAPKDQPPTYYRLLGIDLFESDRDVIASATDQRMAHVRSFQTGKNSALSQRILNELAAAKLCLLDERKKATYDALLRQAQRVSAILPPPLPGGTPAVPIAAIPSTAGETFDAGYPRFKTSRKKHKSGGPAAAAWLLGLAAVAAAAALLTWMFVLKPMEEDRKVAKTEPAASPQKDAPPKIATKPGPHAAPGPAPKKGPNAEPEASSAPEPSIEPKPEAPVDSKTRPKPQPDPQSGPLSKPLTRPEPDPEPQPDFRRDPPDEPAQKAALVTIRHVYKQDYKTADNAAIAKKLLRKGRETGSDPVARFALFREARDLALEARDGLTVFQAIDAMAADYKVNAAEVKEWALVNAGKGVQSQPQHAAIAAAALETIDAAVADERFQVVKRVGRLALAQAHQAKDPALVQQVVAKNKESDADAKTFADAQNALAALETTPDDPAANALAGKYYCFQKGNWKKGLPMLASGNDAALKSLAERDLKGAATPEDQVKLGDDWWQWAEKARGAATSNLQKRAAGWYDLAASAATGMVKDKVESRIKEALTVVTPLGVIQPGNLALASNGTTVSGVASGGEYLLDGNVTNYSDPSLIEGKGRHGIASSPCPCEWTIHFPKTYLLRQIRFLLFDLDVSRYYRYKVEVSADGQAFTPLVDHSRGEWRGWQEIPLPEQPAKAIKLIGLHSSPKDKDKDKVFQIVELEAYSLIPRTPPGR